MASILPPLGCLLHASLVPDLVCLPMEMSLSFLDVTKTFRALWMEAALCQAGLYSVWTCVLLLLFNAAFCRLFGHQQLWTGLMSCPHVTNKCTSLRTLACDFIPNSSPLFQSSTSSPFCTLREQDLMLHLGRSNQSTCICAWLGDAC